MDFNSFKKADLVDMLNEIYNNAKFMSECAKENMERYESKNDICDHARALTYDQCAGWIYDKLGIQYKKLE